MSKSCRAFSRSLGGVRRPVPAVAAVDVKLDALDVTDVSRLNGDVVLGLLDETVEVFSGESLFDADESVVG